MAQRRTLVACTLAWGLFAACGETPAQPGDPDAAATGDANTGGACGARAPRAAEPQVWAGPTGYLGRFTDAIAAAQATIDVQMYIFTVDEIADALIAAKQRGVAVRVLLDPDHEGNPATKTKLTTAGIQTKDAPAVFEFSHAKYLIIDGKQAVVSSGNFTYGAVARERNYGFISMDADDVADLRQVFDADWNNTVFTKQCTRLIVSPFNARSRILELLTSATASLDLELMYITDGAVQDAILAAKQRGVAVRAIMASAGDFSSNAATIDALQAAGIVVKNADTFDMHAKLIIADGVAYVGSTNMSPTSLGKNREVGALIFEPAQTTVIQARFDADWTSEPIAP